jgi:hypothetical protein
MAATEMCRGAGPLTSLWGTRAVVLDGVGIGHATAGVVLGLLGVRAVPMALVVVGWEALEYGLTACAPVSFLQPLSTYLRPSGGALFLLVAGWLAGRLGHWLVRRQREADIYAMDELPSNSSAIWPRRPEPVADAVYEDQFWGGSAQLHLDDHETDELRAALSYRLAELRRAGDSEQWERIGVLESLLARLPARRARAEALIAS